MKPRFLFPNQLRPLKLGTIALFFVLRFSYALWKNNGDNKHVKGTLPL